MNHDTLRHFSLPALLTAAAAAAALCMAPAAFADTSEPVQSAIVGGKTAAQVRADLLQAERSGDMQANGESGLRLNELRPDLYPTAPARATATAKTRAQVRAELAEAIRSGDILSNGETELKLKELNPQRYAPQARTGSTLAGVAQSANVN